MHASSPRKRRARGMHSRELNAVQPRLSELLWSAPKSKRSDKQKVRIIKCSTTFDVRLTTPTPISYSVYHRLTEYFDVSSHFWLKIIANLTLHDVLERYFSPPNCHSHGHSERWLHCFLLRMRTSISCPIFDLHFCLAPKFG